MQGWLLAAPFAVLTHSGIAAYSAALIDLAVLAEKDPASFVAAWLLVGVCIVVGDGSWVQNHELDSVAAGSVGAAMDMIAARLVIVGDDDVAGCSDEDGSEHKGKAEGLE